MCLALAHDHVDSRPFPPLYPLVLPLTQSGVDVKYFGSDLSQTQVVSHLASKCNTNREVCVSANRRWTIVGVAERSSVLGMLLLVWADDRRHPRGNSGTTLVRPVQIPPLSHPLFWFDVDDPLVFPSTAILSTKSSFGEELGDSWRLEIDRIGIRGFRCSS